MQCVYAQVAFEAVIGIECHVQLNTQTKAFCGCTTSKCTANANICPICLAHPVSCSFSVHGLRFLSK